MTGPHVAVDAVDRDRLGEALALARQSIGLSDPNPRVGCVLASAGGDVVGRGFTREAGAAHAEVDALRDARSHGAELRGGTAWVTLEPCSHHGRTPPCCDALLDAGLARVVIALRDPNPRVDGGGISRLRDAGLRVDMLDPDDAIAQAARELNVGFVHRMLGGRPWVRMKIAASLDGRTALPDGRSQWITGEAARADGHAWRARAAAVLTGYGTVRDDDPRLDVRAVAVARQPLRVVVDSRLETPPAARVLQPPGQALLIAAVEAPERADALRATGAELVRITGPGGKVDLAAALDELARREVNELHVEAGHKLNASLLRAGLVDELLVYQAPRLLGEGHPMASLGTLASLTDSLDWRFVECTPVGADLRLRLRRP